MLSGQTEAAVTSGQLEAGQGNKRYGANRLI